MALSFVLLVGAGLLLQNLQRIRTTSPGFSTREVLDTAVNLVSAGYDAPRAQAFQDELLDRVKALPGVESAALGRMTPLSYGSFSSAPVAVDGYQPPADEQPIVQYNEVGPDYFATMGIPLVSGREFTRADDEKGALVAVVNETMVAHYWRGKNPIGERVQVKDRWMQVVGVARDSKYGSVREMPKPFFYVPLRQNFSRGAGLYIRTRLRPETMATALAREVHALDGNLALFEVISLQEQLDRSTSPQLVAVTLVSVLGGLALLLSAIGLYGVMSYAVSQSTRELGLRMALGADASNLLRLVMSRGLTLTGGGVLFGAAAALALTRLLGSLLYKVSPRDPLAFGSALMVMTVAALAACFFPPGAPRAPIQPASFATEQTRNSLTDPSVRAATAVLLLARLGAAVNRAASCTWQVRHPACAAITPLAGRNTVPHHSGLDRANKWTRSRRDPRRHPARCLRQAPSAKPQPVSRASDTRLLCDTAPLFPAGVVRRPGFPTCSRRDGGDNHLRRETQRCPRIAASLQIPKRHNKMSVPGQCPRPSDARARCARGGQPHTMNLCLRPSREAP